MSIPSPNPVQFPKISIGLLTYNHQDFIEQCLESVRLQNYPNIEVFLSDDCSNDRTLEVVKKYLEKHPDFSLTILEKPERLGITKNCNFILSHLKGDYIVLFAGDDIMMPGKLKKQVQALNDNPGASFSYSNCEWFVSLTGKKICNHFGLFQSPPEDLNDIIKDFTIASPTMMMRKSMMPAGGYEERLDYISDFFMVVELMLKGKAVYSPDILVRYRKHGKSITANNFFVSDREKTLAIMADMFAGQADKQKALRYHRAIYFYALASEHFMNGRLGQGLKAMPKIFPYCFSSVKWLVRDAAICLSFFKGLRKRLVKP